MIDVWKIAEAQSTHDSSISPSTVNHWYRLLLRIPRDIRKALATREFDMNGRPTCICGWAIREALARVAGCTAEDIEANARDIPLTCAVVFGGTSDEWRRLFRDVTSSYLLGNIELAFVLALEEAISDDG